MWCSKSFMDLTPVIATIELRRPGVHFAIRLIGFDVPHQVHQPSVVSIISFFLTMTVAPNVVKREMKVRLV